MYYGINNTRSRYSEKAHRALQNPQFRVNWANIEQDTAIQKLKNFLTNVWIAGHLSGNVRKSIQQILFLGSVSPQNQKAQFASCVQRALETRNFAEGLKKFTKKCMDCWTLVRKCPEIHTTNAVSRVSLSAKSKNQLVSCVQTAF